MDMNSIKVTPHKGFTLIELLVVIAIIGLLASVVLASLQTTRVNARDVTRVQAVRQLQNALEIYRNANNGQYPNFSGGVAVNAVARVATFDTALAPYYKATTDTPVYGGATVANTIQYRSGGTVFAPDLSTYTILLRREGLAKVPVSVLSPTGILPSIQWCHISMQQGNTAWTGVYPKCFNQ
jgi:prepilin-type N-terminal cleavage/methylation domain-containing protein